MKEKKNTVKFTVDEQELLHLLDELRCAHNCCVDEINGHKTVPCTFYYVPQPLKKLAELICGFELDANDEWYEINKKD